MLAGAVLVDYLREELLAGAAFAYDEHAQVDGCDAYGTRHGLSKGRSTADDAQPHLGLLHIRFAYVGYQWHIRVITF